MKGDVYFRLDKPTQDNEHIQAIRSVVETGERPLLWHEEKYLLSQLDQANQTIAMLQQQMEYWRSSSDQFADTIRDRDKTIAELQQTMRKYDVFLMTAEQQNTLMLEALERVITQAEISGKREGSHRLFGKDDFTACIEEVRDTIAKVKGTSTPPTHDLAKEVHRDMAWRESE